MSALADASKIVTNEAEPPVTSSVLAGRLGKPAKPVVEESVVVKVRGRFGLVVVCCAIYTILVLSTHQHAPPPCDRALVMLSQCAMVGDVQVGKTTLMVKYVEGRLDQDYIQVGAEAETFF